MLSLLSWLRWYFEHNRISASKFRLKNGKRAKNCSRDPNPLLASMCKGKTCKFGVGGPYNIHGV
jgi:hypothetical protein